MEFNKYSSMKEELLRNKNFLNEMSTSFRFELEQILKIIESIKNLINKILEENTCLYCNNKTDSIDPNVLCPNCRETFGHSFFSDL